MTFSSFSLNGNILSSEILDKIAREDIAFQSYKDFGFDRPDRLRDEIGTAWAVARTTWQAFKLRRDRLKEEDAGTTETRNLWIIPLFSQLGYELVKSTAEVIDQRSYAISHRLSNRDQFPFHITGIGNSLNDRLEHGPRLSTHSLMQDYLNRSEHLYGLISNGSVVRLLRDSTRLVNLAYVEINLEKIMEEELFADFAVFFRLLHITRLSKTAGSGEDSILETYHQKSLDSGSRIREKLSEAVEHAILRLGQGFLEHPANSSLHELISDGILTEKQYYDGLLRLVYRVLFLVVIEERKLVYSEPLPKEFWPLRDNYFKYYSVERLRNLAGKLYSSDDRKSDWYDNLKATMKMFEGDSSCRLLGLNPLSSGLFRPGYLDPFDHYDLRNEVIRDVLKQLTWIQNEQGGISRVNYADLDVEELGSVYERLLDFHPFLDKDSMGHCTFRLSSLGTDRKTTGSYYTRPELVRELVRSALIPVMEARLKEAGPTKEKREEALLAMKVCDPSAGSGHMLLAAGRVLAIELAKIRTGEENPAPTAYREALREVIQHCLYGVDLNPAAVDLCKLALWLDGFNAGKPLSFLDHKIKNGNSLVGITDLKVLETGIPDEAFNAVTGDDPAVAKRLKKENRDFLKGQFSLFGGAESKLDQAQYLIAAEYRSLGTSSQNSAEEQRKVEDLYEKWKNNPERYREKLAADLWTAAFFAHLTPEEEKGAPTSEKLARFLENPAKPEGQAEAIAKGLAQTHNFFHWPLEFPDVAEQGGFDIMLGNPPWERIKLQEQEYFATRDPEIATAANKAARNRLIQTLPERNPALYHEFQEAVHDAESTSKFIRFGGRFTLTAVGDINTYSIFSELFTRQIRPTGRSGYIVPTGIATDDNNKQFFGFLVEQNRLASLFDFENREAIFQNVHRSYKFSLMTVAGGSLPAGFETRFAFFLTQPEQLSDDRRVFTLKKEDFLRLNPNTKTCPVFRTRRDAEITTKIYNRFPILINEQTGENPWGIRFSTMFHMSNDSHLFRTKEELEQAGFILWGNQFIRRDDAGAITDRFLPLYEAKMIWHYDHRFGSYAGVSDRTSTQTPTPSLAHYQDPCYQILPWYWVDEKEVAERLVRRDKFNRIEWAWERKWLMGWRDITNSTNERTYISSISILSACGDTFLLDFSNESSVQHLELSCYVNSIVFDYIVRQKIGGIHLKYHTVKQLPVCLPKSLIIHCLILEMHFTSWDIKPFADDVWNEADDELKAAIRQQWEANRKETGGHDWSPPEWAEDFGKTQAEVTGCPLPPFKWDEDRRAILKAEIDAIVARLYGLTDEELRYILDPQDVYGPDFPGETFRVLKEKEIRLYGEYRTKRLVLEAWERGKGEE